MLLSFFISSKKKLDRSKIETIVQNSDIDICNNVCILHLHECRGGGGGGAC